MAWTDIPQYVIDDIFGFQDANQMVDNFDFLKAGGVGTVYLANLAVTAAKLGASAVETAKINALAVTEAKMATSSVNQGALKTSTGVSSGTLNSTISVEITMQEYTFAPNYYAATLRMVVAGQLTTSTGTVGRLSIYNLSGVDTNPYTIRWRYVTATDEPFLYAIQNKTTGEIEHLWMCEDPPPGYWGLDNKPDDFIPPVILSDSLIDREEITIFKHPKDEFFDIINRAEKEKKMQHEILNGMFEYDKDKKLFKAKNLTEI